MFNPFLYMSNRAGIPRLATSAVAVGTAEVTFTVPSNNAFYNTYNGLILLKMEQEIPAGTTTTLPIALTSNAGTKRITALFLTMVMLLSGVVGVAAEEFDVTDYVNPFTGNAYDENSFYGNGTIIIILSHEKSIAFLARTEEARRINRSAFIQESRAAARLSHPNIVKVFDVSFGDVLQYIVMEYIEGKTLKQLIED